MSQLLARTLSFVGLVGLVGHSIVAGPVVVTALAALTAPSAMALEVHLPPPPPIVLPGLPGRVDVSRLPLPRLVLPNPVIIAPPPLPPQRPGVVVATPAPRPQPVYVWVPPGHQKKWAKHCHRYQACGVPVYFVRDDWYDRHVHRGAKHAADVEDDRRGRGHGYSEGKGGEGKGHGKSKGD